MMKKVLALTVLASFNFAEAQKDYYLSTDEALLSVRDFGSADISSKADGTVIISGKMGEVPYYLYLRDCSPDYKACNRITIVAKLKNKSVSLGKINAANSHSLTGRVFYSSLEDVVHFSDEIYLIRPTRLEDFDSIFDHWNSDIKCAKNYIK